MAATTGGAVTTGTTAASSTTSDGGSSSSSGDTNDTSPRLDVPADGQGAPCDSANPNCPDGFKCMPVFRPPNIDAECAPVPEDPLSPGDPCVLESPLLSASPDDPCDETSVCVSPGGDYWEGVCGTMCPGGVRDCPLAGDVCLVAYGGSLRVCAPGCNPIAPDCIEGAACHVSPPNLELFACAPEFPGAGQHGSLCQGAQALCQSGFACFPDAVASEGCAGTWCCTPYCDRSAPNDCPGPGEECISTTTATPPPGLENVGVCAIPA